MSSKPSYVSHGQYFRRKDFSKATMEMYAMRCNCYYMITKSDTKFWCIRCIDKGCDWHLRAECLERSTYFKINKFVENQTCARSKKANFVVHPLRKQLDISLCIITKVCWKAIN